MSSIERATIEIDLERPASERARAFSDVAVAQCLELLNGMKEMISPNALRLADLVRLRTLDRFQDEAQSLADRHGLSWREIVLANISYDLFLSIGCSTAAMPGPDGPVLARNMDWFPEGPLARATYRVRCSRGGRHAFTHAGWPGSIGIVTGLSANGFAVALNAVGSPEGANLQGYPVLLFLRTVVEDARDFDDALAQLTSQTLAMSALFTLVGTRNNQRVVIERSPTKHALRWGQDGTPLFATNHYRSLCAGSGEAHNGASCSRYDRLCKLLNQPRDDSGAWSDTELLAALSDPGVMQEITAQQIVARPYLGDLRAYIPAHLA